MKHKSQTEQKLIFNSMDEKATQERALKFFGGKLIVDGFSVFSIQKQTKKGVARDAERIVAILKQMNQSTVVVRDFYAFMDKLGESDKNATGMCLGRFDRIQFHPKYQLRISTKQSNCLQDPRMDLLYCRLIVQSSSLRMAKK